MNESTGPVLTIGHSNQTLDSFLGKLRNHSVTALVDVRSVPYSRFAPQFNRNILESDAKAAGIRYLFLGKELGARSEDPACYLNGRVQYESLARTELFKSGIARIIRGAQKYRIAIMCTEKEPLQCHRTLLVSRALENLGISVEHILPNGQTESQARMLERLLDLLSLPHEDLFRTREDLIAEAVQRQEKKIAYLDDDLTNVHESLH